MKRLIVCTLLVLVPFASVRMICLTPHPDDARTADAVADTEAAPDDDCSRFCLLPPDGERGPNGEGRADAGDVQDSARTSCALFADPTCAFTLTAAVAVMPAPRPASSPRSVVTVLAAIAPSYAEPIQSPVSPPPEA